MGSQEYYFIAGNYFCVSSDTYFPAELAIVKFTFEHGVISKFHTYINPGNISATDWRAGKNQVNVVVTSVTEGSTEPFFKSIIQKCLIITKW